MKQRGRQTQECCAFLNWVKMIEKKKLSSPSVSMWSNIISLDTGREETAFLYVFSKCFENSENLECYQFFDPKK